MKNDSSRESNRKWEELNQQLSEAMKDNNWATMKQCYNEMAYIVAKEGKSANHLIKERNKCELMNYNGVFEKVKILTARNECCKYCASLEGKILTIKEALETMPIPGNCSNDVFETGHSFCRCCYVAVIDSKRRRLNDIKWGELNRKILSYSKKGDWQNVIKVYQEQIDICKEEGKDFSHILKAIEKIESLAKSEKRQNNFAGLIVIIFVCLFIYIFIFKPISCLMNALK